jgi:histidine kinase
MSKKNPFREISEQIQIDQPDLAYNYYSFDTLDKQRLQALYVLSQQLNRILDPDKIFKELIVNIVKLLEVERAIILLIEQDQLRIRISHNIDEASEKNALNFSHTIVSKVIQDFKPLYSSNALNDSRFSQIQTIHKLEILSFICVPIRIGKDILGTIYVDNRHLTKVLTGADVEFLQAIANLVAIALHNSMAYQQIEELNFSLEEKVRQRTEKLQKTVGELRSTQDKLIQSEKMASLGRVIAGFIHEFNNPINFIYSNLPHLREYSQKLVAELKSFEESAPELTKQDSDLQYIKKDLLKLIDGMQEGAERSRKIVEDLRNFSGIGFQNFQMINWNENLKSVIKVFKKGAEGSVKIKVSSEDIFFVEGNKGELNQAILNLLNNGIGAGANRIQINNSIDGDYLKCEIEDNGKGIPQDKLSKIFDPFFTTKEVGKGMGLGLSIVYSNINHHNGRIEVSSKVNQGTTFKLFLPLSQK